MVHFVRLIGTEVVHFTQFAKVLLAVLLFCLCHIKMHVLLPNECESAVLTRGAVMTAGANDTPLNEAPGAENMPNQ